MTYIGNSNISCAVVEGAAHRMLGTVILMKDPTTGGIMTRTIVNATLSKHLANVYNFIP